MIEDALTSLLMADSTLRSIVSDRVYALRAPQKVVTPYIVFTKVIEMATGTLCAQDPMVRDLFQFDSYATTYNASLLMAKALRKALIDFRGTVGDTYIASVRLDMEMQVLEPDPGLYRVSTSLFIWLGELV